jgi:hypothetical protein
MLDFTSLIGDFSEWPLGVIEINQISGTGVESSDLHQITPLLQL